MHSYSIHWYIFVVVLKVQAMMSRAHFIQACSQYPQEFTLREKDAKLVFNMDKRQK